MYVTSSRINCDSGVRKCVSLNRKKNTTLFNLKSIESYLLQYTQWALRSNRLNPSIVRTSRAHKLNNLLNKIFTECIRLKEYFSETLWLLQFSVLPEIKVTKTRKSLCVYIVCGLLTKTYYHLHYEGIKLVCKFK